MAGMMLRSSGQAAWMRDGSVRAARRGWARTAFLIVGTLAVALGSFSLSLKVSSERRETDRLARQTSALESQLKALDTELKVRMRLPQLQQWNDDILGMVPISATQYLANPVQLANYGKALPGDAPALPAVQFAVRDVPARPATAQPILVAAPATPSRPSAPLAVDPLLIIAAAQPAPQQAAMDDLLRQVELTFQASPANP